MPIIKSAKKRARQSVARRQRNLVTLKRVKETRKALVAAKASGTKKKVDDARRELQSAVDTAVKKNIMHKNRAARILSRALKSTEPTTGSNQQSAAKKSVAKKAPAKKPAAKK
jgi:ribosomal protein S20